MNKYRKLSFLLSIISLLCLSATSLAASRTYSVGVVPQFSALRTIAIWQPILDAISHESGIELELNTSASIPDFEQQVYAGSFDFAYMNPYHLLIANEKQGYLPVLRDVDRRLYGIIVVRKDSNIVRVNQLDGETIAFPAPNALGATLIPRADFDEKFNIQPDPVYVNSHSSVYLNVLLGKTVAGGGVQKTLSQQSEEIRSQLRILYKTTEVSPHPLAVHPRINHETRLKLLNAFIKLANTENGIKLLSKVPMQSIGKATLEDYDDLKKINLSKYYLNK